MKRNFRISQAKCLEVQKELVGNASKVMSTVDLGNIVAGIKGWPRIVPGQQNCRALSRSYIVKYLSSRQATNKAPK